MHVHLLREIHESLSQAYLPEDPIPGDGMLACGVEEDVRLLLGILVVRVKEGWFKSWIIYRQIQ